VKINIKFKWKLAKKNYLKKMIIKNRLVFLKKLFGDVLIILGGNWEIP
jgi:hypothetical protein